MPKPTPPPPSHHIKTELLSKCFDGALDQGKHANFLVEIYRKAPQSHGMWMQSPFVTNPTKSTQPKPKRLIAIDEPTLCRSTQ